MYPNIYIRIFYRLRSSQTSFPSSAASSIFIPLFPAGPVAVSKSPPPLSEVEKSFVEVKAGGRGQPADCVARYRVAIIIPFRDRPQHLQTLLYNLHPILLRQQIDYQIFVIEQEGELLMSQVL